MAARRRVVASPRGPGTPDGAPDRSGAPRRSGNRASPPVARRSGDSASRLVLEEGFGPFGDLELVAPRVLEVLVHYGPAGGVLGDLDGALEHADALVAQVGGGCGEVVDLEVDGPRPRFIAGGRPLPRRGGTGVLEELDGDVMNAVHADEQAGVGTSP